MVRVRGNPNHKQARPRLKRRTRFWMDHFNTNSVGEPYGFVLQHALGRWEIEGVVVVDLDHCELGICSVRLSL